ncbi:sulfate ABC transporter ATP-binding protein [Chromobacterium phragmitis]|uniref:Sulfate ABC transporter ATP-binding protein n=1 Tax=Chromobacterium phragmitis TaxID=2202141 RepID=A0A344UN61_9NEIS|nr:sulfate ABC transporter ATP-binding protein [Chromobacterium phragmitis]AXE31327.1 sulfate ABC transporter ATP-binding protein [Chromobacterium phragmitis]AXE36709.1 sulfate ABC transporter ATP-binding protein [Chromobacterium phragmitis]
MSIQVENIRKAFGDFAALDDVSLNFPGGELVALLGPSGCGKTTLLRIIAGLEQADAGRVLLDGQDASATHVRERQVGFVFQHYALFRHMSVFDNVAFGLRMKPRRERPSEAEIARKVHALLDLVQLDWLADRLPAQLSGGQRQRIALARALAVEPRVLLLDEPFGALDAKVRKELRRWLRKLHDELHITSIFVTHDQEEALEVADRVVLMNHGKVEQIGSPAEVYARPASAFVYGFLGSANRIRGVSRDGAIAVDGHMLDAEHQLPLGQTVEAFIRPHDLSIEPDQDGAGLPARVLRVLTLGGLSRIELEGRGELAGLAFDAELPADAPLLETLAAGQDVRLRARAARVFAADAQGGGA